MLPSPAHSTQPQPPSGKNSHRGSGPQAFKGIKSVIHPVCERNSRIFDVTSYSTPLDPNRTPHFSASRYRVQYKTRQTNPIQ
ncbi:hypothetical protein BDW74DRAFT_149156 [Aspergillus multicolor]|uniref:uncharacterized protein n=1 Tax=Aspergillus multicolor TaxID=41759 RepID=UPI003CCCC5F9